MKRRQVYAVRYNLHGQKRQFVEVLAENKYQAYDIAVYEKIPEIEGEHPYSAWVSSVTYQNGNWHEFNTCEGLPY